MPYIKIGNDINLLEYVESEGIKITVEKVIGKTVTTRDGKDHENVIRTRRKISVDFPDLAGEYVRQILSAVSPKLVTVTTDLDPVYGNRKMTMRCEDRSASLKYVYDNGTQKWSGFSLELVEQ